MVKMSFSGSDSEQYSNVEPPGIERLSATSTAMRDLCWSKGIHVTMQLRKLERMRKLDRDLIAHLTA